MEFLKPFLITNRLQAVRGLSLVMKVLVLFIGTWYLNYYWQLFETTKQAMNENNDPEIIGKLF